VLIQPLSNRACSFPFLPGLSFFSATTEPLWFPNRHGFFFAASLFFHLWTVALSFAVPCASRDPLQTTVAPFGPANMPPPPRYAGPFYAGATFFFFRTSLRPPPPPRYGRRVAAPNFANKQAPVSPPPSRFFLFPAVFGRRFLPLRFSSCFFPQRGSFVQFFLPFPQLCFASETFLHLPFFQRLPRRSHDSGSLLFHRLFPLFSPTQLGIFIVGFLFRRSPPPPLSHWPPSVPTRKSPFPPGTRPIAPARWFCIFFLGPHTKRPLPPVFGAFFRRLRASFFPIFQSLRTPRYFFFPPISPTGPFPPFCRLVRPQDPPFSSPRLEVTVFSKFRLSRFLGWCTVWSPPNLPSLISRFGAVRIRLFPCLRLFRAWPSDWSGAF